MCKLLFFCEIACSSLTFLPQPAYIFTRYICDMLHILQLCGHPYPSSSSGWPQKGQFVLCWYRATNQLELSNQISTLLMINNQMISGSVLRWCASICQVTDNFINFHSVSQNSRQPNTFKQNMTLAVALDSYFLATIPCTVVILF